MPSTIKVAEYLFTRLRQLGVGSVHGVPGDFNLTLLDYVEPAGLQWVGNANELNAGYAADGYSRLKGIGALITTFGVGELSAINAIAGAYAERAPVVHIVGTPQRSLQDSRALMHHTFNDGDYRRFSQMHAQVTIAQASLRDPRTAPEQIDEVLRLCLMHSRPIYIQVPVDVVDALVSAERLESQITVSTFASEKASEAALAKVLEKVYAAKQPIIFVDGETRALGIVEEVQSLVTSTQWPTWILQYAKGLLDETQANFHGLWRGKWDDAKVTKFFDAADLVLCFGAHFSNTNAYSYTSIPKADVAVYVTDTEIKVGSEVFRDVPAKQAITQLLQKLDLSRVKAYSPYPDLPHDYKVSFSEVNEPDKLTQDKFYRIFSNYLRPGDVILCETGSPGYGGRDMLLPPQTRLYAPVTWLSIGYMLPATQGAALAQRELMNASRWQNGIKDGRTILIIGDGSFQMTAQELATIIHLDLDVILILVNNDGYTIERCIHGRNQRYNDITPWRYLKAPEFFGADQGSYTAAAKTWGELKDILEGPEIKEGKGLRMVEVFMDKEDFPTGPLTEMLEKQRVSDQQQNGKEGGK